MAETAGNDTQGSTFTAPTGAAAGPEVWAAPTGMPVPNMPAPGEAHAPEAPQTPVHTERKPTAGELADEARVKAMDAAFDEMSLNGLARQVGHSLAKGDKFTAQRAADVIDRRLADMKTKEGKPARDAKEETMLRQGEDAYRRRLNARTQKPTSSTPSVPRTEAHPVDADATSAANTEPAQSKTPSTTEAQPMNGEPSLVDLARLYAEAGRNRDKATMREISDLLEARLAVIADEAGRQVVKEAFRAFVGNARKNQGPLSTLELADAITRPKSTAADTDAASGAPAVDETQPQPPARVYKAPLPLRDEATAARQAEEEWQRMQAPSHALPNPFKTLAGKIAGSRVVGNLSNMHPDAKPSTRTEKSIPPATRKGSEIPQHTLPTLRDVFRDNPHALTDRVFETHGNDGRTARYDIISRFDDSTPEQNGMRLAGSFDVEVTITNPDGTVSKTTGRMQSADLYNMLANNSKEIDMRSAEPARSATSPQAPATPATEVNPALEARRAREAALQAEVNAMFANPNAFINYKWKSDVGVEYSIISYGPNGFEVTNTDGGRMANIGPRTLQSMLSHRA